MRNTAKKVLEGECKKDYTFSYNPAPIPDEYAGYSAVIDVDSLRNGNIQKVTVTIRHHDKEVTTLESYEVNR